MAIFLPEDQRLSPRDIPIIGGWVGKLGRVRKIYATPCDDPDPYLAVLAFWHSTPYLVWDLFGPDCIDLVDERRGRGHRRKRKLRWNPGHMEEGQPAKGGWGWRFWKLGDKVQKWGWHFGVIDASSNFIINWMSLPMIWTGCNVPGAAQAHANAPNNPWAVLTNHNWEILDLALVSHFKFIYGTGRVIVGENHDYHSAVDMKVKPWPGLPPVTSFQVRVRDMNTNQIVSEGEAEDDGAGGLEFQQVAGSPNFVHAPTTICLEVRNNHPANIFGSTWNVSGVKDGAGFGPDGCGLINKDPTKWPWEWDWGSLIGP